MTFSIDNIDNVLLTMGFLDKDGNEIETNLSEGLKISFIFMICTSPCQLHVSRIVTNVIVNLYSQPTWILHSTRRFLVALKQITQ